MISLDYVKRLKYKRCVGDAEKDLRGAKRALRLTKEALDARIEEDHARGHKEKTEDIIKNLLIHKSFSSNAKVIEARFKEVSAMLKALEDAVEAERTAFTTVRGICTEFSKSFDRTYTNWDVRGAAIEHALVPEHIIEEDTVKVKVCGKVDILSSGAIKRSIRESFFTLAPREAFERTGIILRCLRCT